MQRPTNPARTARCRLAAGRWRPRWAAPATALVGAALLAVLVVVPAGAGQAGRVLQVGMWGGDVFELQQQLRELGFSQLQATGRFDKETEQAVRRLQQAVGLAVDGMVGPGTRQVLSDLARPMTHTVRPGESLWELSRRFATSMQDLMEANALKDTTLRPGQRLTVPSVRELHLPATMRVRELAARLGVPADDVAALNGLQPTDAVKAGSALWVPLPRFGGPAMAAGS